MSWLDIDLGGRKVRVAVARDGNGVWVGWNGMGRRIDPERNATSAAVTVERELRAPMTGKVVKVAVSPGSSVRVGEVLVVLEAMKMEYRLVAPREGIVESVTCKEGDRVDLGHVVVTLAP